MKIYMSVNFLSLRHGRPRDIKVAIHFHWFLHHVHVT